MRPCGSGVCFANLVGGVLVIGDALCLEQLIQFARKRHLGDDIAAADKLALDVKLRDSGPVGEILDALADLGVGEHAQVLADADDFLRQAETGAAATKSRLWLNHPASPRQRELLARAGDADPTLDFGLSKYAANCRLNFLWNRPQIIAAVFPNGLRSAA